MPKANSARILDAQRQRQNISKKAEKYAPSTVYLQVLGSGAKGAPNTLYVFTDQKRYLFNCGESTQRLAHEHKVKLSRLEHIFVTAKTWRNIGGLPGLSLTLQDVGVPKLTLHGPEGLDELYQATKRFVIMKDMNVTMAECSPTVDFEDNVMSVKYVLLTPHESLSKDLTSLPKKPRLDGKVHADSKEIEKFIQDNTDYYQSNNKRKRDNSKSRFSPEKDGKTKTEKAQELAKKKAPCTVAYICTLKKRLGTLDLAKCVEMGVPPGPLLGQLKAGYDVVLSSGKLVLSKDVKTPDDPGPVFIVLEVPELSYLKETEFSAHFDTPANPPERIPALVVHYTPPHVMKEPKYREFMSMFGRDTKHLVLNSQNTCLGSEAVHRTQHKLHLLDSDIFPLLRDASIQAVWNPSPLLTESAKSKVLEDLKNKVAMAQFQNIITMEDSSKGDAEVKPDVPEDKFEVYEGKTLTLFHLRPKREIDRSAEPKLHVQDYIQETMDIDGFITSLDTFRKQVDNIRYLQSDATEFPKVIFLGTGSCIPSKTRNTSGMVLQIDENKSMLLDCGEGTLGQLVRFFGPKRIDSFLRTLRAIYISHLHADHHIGLIGVLHARRQAFKHHPTQECHAPYEPLYLLAPGQIMSWLNMYDQQFERIRQDFTIVPNQKLLHTETTDAELTSAALACIGVEHVNTCFVSHCPNAFGVAIDVDQNHKITYSGDTIPCEELVKIGDKSTLLIHEATMEDELADEARTKMHSTTSQAIEQGQLMKAKYTVLTHFSQRYARLPRLNAHILNDNRSVGIAFDNMQITMSDLKLLPHMYAPLQFMFAEHCVELEMKAAHRARQKERNDPSQSDNLGSHKGRDRERKRNCDRSRNRSYNIGSNRSRNSSSCRVVESAPRPAANYRESNASRLRQELKGMTVTGVVRGPRSASSTPATPKTRSRPSSLHSDSGAHINVTTPHDVSSSKSSVVKDAPRTMSDTTNASARLAASRARSTSRPNSVSGSELSFEGSTKSSSSPRQRSSDRSVIVTNNLKCRTNSRFTGVTPSEEPRVVKSQPATETFHVEESAYGKPLVTNISKRLKIMRYTPTPIWFDHKDLSKMRQVSPRSPVRSIKSVVANDRDSKSRTSSLRSPVRSMKLKESSPTSSLSKRAVSKIPTKSTLSSGNKLQATNASVKAEKKVTETPDTTRSRTQSLSRTSSPKRHSVDNTVALRDTKMAVVARQSPDRRIVQRKSYGPLRDIVTERLKQPLCKGSSPPLFGRHPQLYNSRSYKPQLEDIKSSYLLLNKQAREQKAKNSALENETKWPVIVPPPINEEERKKQLIEVKKKFQSKGFFVDSKYDKIEGLNWISWK